MSTKVGDRVQAIRVGGVPHGTKGTAVKVDDDIFDGYIRVRWDTGKAGMMAPGFAEWINLGNPPPKDMSVDADHSGNYNQEALLGQRRRR